MTALRPPNPAAMTLDQLQPGDILLSCGDDLLDQAIMAIDQTDYSHATEYVGFIEDPATGQKQHMVIEATTKGIDLNPITVDLEAQTLVDAYRFVSDDGHHIGDDDWPADPVLDVAKKFVGGKYAFDKLLMLGVVIAASETVSKKGYELLIRLGGAQVIEKIAAWINHTAEKTPMTCVEVVVTAHWQAAANPPNKYGIAVDLPGGRRPITPARPMPEAAETEDFQGHYAELRTQLVTQMKLDQLNPLSDGPSAAKFFAGSELLPGGACSLRDIQASDNLQLLGCIQDKR